MKKMFFSFVFLFCLSFCSDLLGLDLKESYDPGLHCYWPCSQPGGNCVEVLNSCETLGGGACGPGTGQPNCQ